VFRSDKQAFVMPVRVHCEDTAPHGVVQIHSLVAFAERIRSLCLKQQMHVSLDDLRKQKLAILATEYVVEIVGKDVGVMHTLRLESSVEFPGAPLFPWDMKIYAEDNSLYATGMFGLNLCSISDSGAYAGVTEDQYRSWTSGLKKYVTAQPKFSANSLRFFHAFPKLGTPFRPCKRHEGTYIVRSTDCDMYNVLFQARVPAMMESCHPDRRDAISFYVNIRMSVRPGDELVIHVLSTADAALFICMKDKTAVLTAFGHYGTRRPIGQEEIKCGSFRLPILQKYFNTGDKPAPNEDVDLSDI
jgi:acyl-CoA thioesterase FadM